MSAAAAPAAPGMAEQIGSVRDGHLDAAKLLQAIREGGDAAQLVQATIEQITALRDGDRLAAFSRTIAKALQFAA